MAGMADGRVICPHQIGTTRRSSRARLRAETFPYNIQDVRRCRRVTRFGLVDREDCPGGLALKTACRIARHFEPRSPHDPSNLEPRGKIGRTGAMDPIGLPDRGEHPGGSAIFPYVGDTRLHCSRGICSSHRGLRVRGIWVLEEFYLCVFPA